MAHKSVKNMKILFALIRKEITQVLRDPTALVTAVLYPLFFVLICFYCIQLDNLHIKYGIRNENPCAETATLVDSFDKNEYVTVRYYDNDTAAENDLANNEIQGILTIPNDFMRKLERGEKAEVFLAADASFPSLANYAQMYAESILSNWYSQNKYAMGKQPSVVNSNVRAWYDQELQTKNFLQIVMFGSSLTTVSILFSSLVVAREWENNNMELLLATDVMPFQIIVAKYIVCYLVAIISWLIDIFFALLVFQVPFRGNVVVLFFVTSLYILCTLGIGLGFSARYRKQFPAILSATGFGSLPPVFLSGAIFPIISMPPIWQWLLQFYPVTYFVVFLKSEFLAGTHWEYTIFVTAILVLLALINFGFVWHFSSGSLDE